MGLRFAFLGVVFGLVICLPFQLTAEQGGAPVLVDLPVFKTPLADTNPFFPLSEQAEPKTGDSFRDPWTGVCITRVTDRGRQRHFYSRIDPYNADGTLIVLHAPDTGYYHVYGTGTLPYNSQDNQVGERFALDDPRWDPKDPALLWGVDEFSLVTLNVLTGEKTVQKDFNQDPVTGPVIAAEPDLYRITVKYEGEPSRNFRYWAFALQGTDDDYRLRHVLCWDRQEDKVVGFKTLAPEESDIDWVGMSPLGNWVVLAGMYNNSGDIPGLCIADRTLNRFHRINYGTAHSDVGLDVHGNEVLVIQNTRTDRVDLVPLREDVLPILEPGASYEGTGRIPLIRLNYSSSDPGSLASAGLHISCNAPGWCLISPHIKPGVRERNWLDRSLILVRLDSDAPKVYGLAKLHHDYQEYWEETHAVLSNDGTRALWVSNWGENPGSNRVFLLEANLAPGYLRRAATCP